MQYRTVKTSELKTGDVVNCHGMRCLIDGEIQVSKSHRVSDIDGSHCRYTRALVLNREDVPASVVPLSFTVDYGSNGRKQSDEPRWTIQGNDLATWAVEVPGPYWSLTYSVPTWDPHWRSHVGVRVQAATEAEALEKIRKGTAGTGYGAAPEAQIVRCKLSARQ